MNRRSTSDTARRVALCAMLVALSMVVLYLASVAPAGRLGLTAVAGLFPAAAVISFGLPAGFLCYGATALLALLLVSDKGLALLYALFFGLYPMVKGLIERLRRIVVELPLKLLFFNGVLTLFYFGFSNLFFQVVFFAELSTALVYLVGNVVFLVYDLGFSQVIGFYMARVDRLLKKR